MKLTLLVGPPGSGKSTLAKQYVSEGFEYINQDSQGKDHLKLFESAVSFGRNVVVDRMNFSKFQRDRYLVPSKEKGYETEIIVLHQPYSVCFERVMARKDHETIKDEVAARQALGLFFSKYERVQDNEANKVTRIWPEGDKPSAIVCDLDGTLCNVDHRLHHVRPPKNILVGPDGSMINVLGNLEPHDMDKPLPKFKRNWKGFFDGIKDDPVNEWCADILESMGNKAHIVFCSGRPDNYRRDTLQWLEEKARFFKPTLFMRHRNDSRQDNIAKEIILDFEILTRFTPYFMIDDRKQVVDMWRSRGFTCLQCADGDF